MFIHNIFSSSFIIDAHARLSKFCNTDTKLSQLLGIYLFLEESSDKEFFSNTVDSQKVELDDERLKIR